MEGARSAVRRWVGVLRGDSARNRLIPGSGLPNRQFEWNLGARIAGPGSQTPHGRSAFRRPCADGLRSARHGTFSGTRSAANRAELVVSYALPVRAARR